VACGAAAFVLVALLAFGCQADVDEQLPNLTWDLSVGTGTGLAEPVLPVATKSDPTPPFHEYLSELAGPFDTVEAATEPCRDCHGEVAEQVMKSIHWPYGSTSDDEDKVDCLGCHANPALYVRTDGGARKPKDDVKLSSVAQSVGIPTRASCGECHFDGDSQGQGAVKKTVPLLPSSLAKPTPEEDVHMGRLDFRCQACHTFKEHVMAGPARKDGAADGRASCTDCHTGDTHVQPILNKHASRIVCQSCHLPEAARKGLTLVWDGPAADSVSKLHPLTAPGSTGPRDTRLNHQVPPATQALGCDGCHSGAIDFSSLGYSGDPKLGGASFRLIRQ